MNRKADLHLHTTASDGALSPKELVYHAKKMGVNLIAITDHDTISGIAPAMEAGLKAHIRVLPGIELSTLHEGESVHILGYFKGDAYTSPELNSFLKDMHLYRVTRAEKIVENLKTYFHIELNKEKLLAAKGVLARPHIAKAIQEEGYDYDWNYIFKHILSKDSPAYVPNKKISVQEGIALLKKFDALTSLAHPVLLRNHSIEEMMKFDFDAVEAIYPLNEEKDTLHFSAVAKSHNKLITAGSDFHGLSHHDEQHGTLGSAFLDGEELDLFLNQL